MNTAPKLLELADRIYGAANWDHPVQPNVLVMWANEIRGLAALAPPSGEGVDSKCPHCGAPTRREILMRGGDNGWGDDASRTVYRYATPQSAPADGDLEALIKAEYGNAMRQLNAEGKRATQTSIRELAEILALRPTTPPPASQERGDADRVIRRLWSLMGPKVPPCCEGCNFEWTKAIEEMRNYLGSDAYPAASPAATVDVGALAELVEDFRAKGHHSCAADLAAMIGKEAP